MNHEKELRDLENKINDITTQRIQKTERLNGLRRQRDEIVTQIQAEGLTPETLNGAIMQLEQAIEQDINILKAQMPEGI